MKTIIVLLLTLTFSDFAGANMSTKTQTAYLAGGCFWGVEDLLRKLPGVISTDVGYTGGSRAKTTYAEVKEGNTGNAEAVKIVFDPAKTSYGKILDYFFRIHDPTTIDRQGNDVGTQYRSAIFFTDSEQEREARAAITRAGKSGLWKSPIVTRLEAFSNFTLGEEYHQDYLVKNPNGYTCHWERK